MLKNYVMCVPLIGKCADTVVNAYLREIYCTFEAVKNLHLTMNVNSKTHYSEIALQCGIKCIHSSPNRPQAKGRIEASYNFLKYCTRKFAKRSEVEWHEVLSLFPYQPKPKNLAFSCLKEMHISPL